MGGQKVTIAVGGDRAGFDEELDPSLPHLVVKLQHVIGLEDDLGEGLRRIR